MFIFQEISPYDASFSFEFIRDFLSCKYFSCFLQLYAPFPFYAKDFLWSFQDQMEKHQKDSLSEKIAALQEGFKVTRQCSCDWTRHPFILTCGLYRRALDLKCCGNVYRTESDVLSKLHSSFDTSACVKRIVTLKTQLDKEHIPFYVMIAPPRLAESEQEKFFPNGPKDWQNQNLNEFFASLNDRNISYYDARMVLNNNPSLHYELLWKTDTHWQGEYAFLTFQNVVPELLRVLNSQETQGVAALRNPDFWNRTFQPRELWGNNLLGNVGWLYVMPENGEFLPVPKENKTFHLNIPGVMDSKDADFLGLFVYQIYSEVNIMNPRDVQNPRENTQICRRILLLRDSYSWNFLPYLALLCDEVKALDLRAFHGNFWTVLQDFQPDCVMMMYSPDTLPEIEGILRGCQRDFFN